jgi:hypothetical protein
MLAVGQMNLFHAVSSYTYKFAYNGLARDFTWNLTE